MLIAPGVTFQDNVVGDCSALRLGYFLASCTVTGIAITDLTTESHVEQVSATVPVSNQGDGSMWFDSTLNIFRVKQSFGWGSPRHGGSSLTSSFAGIMAKGSWVSGTGTFTTALTATMRWPETLGVLVSTAASLVDMVVARTGIWEARLVGPVNYGDVLVAFTGAFGERGYAGAATMLSGYGNTTFTAGLELGFALGAIAGLTTGLITCLIVR